jgi:membrane-associated phospholipid phosphatase
MPFNIHTLIDRSPELPYFILAVIYLLGTTNPEVMHIFSVAFIFVVTSLASGLFLKSFFKTKRPIKHYDLPSLRYDFPSLHSMISIGTIVFVYYVAPAYSLLLTPVGLFYLYSRLKLKAHSVKGVVGGALLGIMLGYLFGRFMHDITIPEYLDMAFAVMLFCIPVFSALFRRKYSDKLDF